MTKNNSQLNIY